MKCSVFIGCSFDGFIAREDGAIDWMDTAGKPDVEIPDNPDLGFSEFISNIDCLVMGSNTLKKLSSFNLSADQWPYGDTRIIALSKSLQEVPENLCGNAEIFSGDIPELIQSLENEGYKHAYVDGGRVIQSFLKLKLMNEMTITLLPILIGKGISLFADLPEDIHLELMHAQTFPNDFIQTTFRVKYD